MGTRQEQSKKKSRSRPIIIGAGAALLSMVLVILLGALVLSFPPIYERLAPPFDLASQPAQALRGELSRDEDGTLILIPEDQRGAWYFRLPPSFLAARYEAVRIEVEDPPIFTDVEAFWGLRKRPERDQRLRLQLDGNTYVGHLPAAHGAQERPAWRDVVLDFGLRTSLHPAPFTVKSITLEPPTPTPWNVLSRIWKEWATLEGYTGYTINGQRMAGREALFPIGLAAGLSLYLAWALIWLWRRQRQPQLALLPALIVATITIWATTDIRWKREMIHEAAAAWDRYAGKTLEEKRLAEPDAYLFEVAQTVKELIPEPPQRIQILRAGRYEPLRLHYYLLPHNVSSRIGSLRSPDHENTTSPGTYVLTLDDRDQSWNVEDNVIRPGYRVEVLHAGDDFRLYRILGPA